MTGDAGASPRFERLDDGRGISVVDPIEDCEYPVFTDRLVTLTETDTNQFYFPVTAAVELDVDRIATAHTIPLWIRTQAGEMVGQTDHEGSFVGEHGNYLLEFGSTPMKLYLLVDGAVEVAPEETGITIDLSAADRVCLGARSYHNHPAVSITAPETPEAAMEALSYLGSTLKTHSPERSFPSLRGHPPQIDIGSSLDIPDVLSIPDSGVRIVVPPDWRYVYPAAPLAHYLAADVVAGSPPRIELAGTDVTIPLHDEAYEDRIATILQKHLFFDCVCRTEGLYDVTLKERQQVDAALSRPVEWAMLYEMPLPERMAAYTRLDWEEVAEYAPEWRLCVHVDVEASVLETLPYLADQLAIIRTTGGTECRHSKSEPEALKDFYRGTEPCEFRSCIGRPSAAIKTCDQDHSRLHSHNITETETESDSYRNATGSWKNDIEIVQLEDSDTTIQAYVGPGFPQRANKATVDSLRRVITDIEADRTTSIAVICNDEEMREEELVGDLYGTRDLFEMDVETYRDTTTEDLREIFATDRTFIHYIGHVDERGLQCKDEYLSIEEIEHVGADAFFLNGCESFREGQALIERGSIAGIVTVKKVLNTPAIDIGRSVARFLNYGWPLATALKVLQDYTIAGHRYTIVGDGSAEIVNPRSAVPNYVRIKPVPADESVSVDEFTVDLYAFTSSMYGMGSMFEPYLANNKTYYLTGGFLDQFVLARSALTDFLERETIPVALDREFYWSDDLLSMFRSEGCRN